MAALPDYVSFLIHHRNLVTAIALIIGGTLYGIGVQQRDSGVAGHIGESGQTKVRRGRAPTIGPYRLDMSTVGISNLVELTPAEKAALNASIEFEHELVSLCKHDSLAGCTYAAQSVARSGNDSTVTFVICLCFYIPVECPVCYTKKYFHISGQMPGPANTSVIK